MLDELKFVKGAIGKKDLIPYLTHFKIEDGTIRSFNGVLALSSPINFDINCVPKAEPFIKAIQNCKETAALHMTPAKRLGVSSGAFKAFIDCVDDETPHVAPEGETFEIDGEALLKALKTINPFIGDDASRPWSNGILINGQSAFATNNVMVIEYWIGSLFPIVCNLPKATIREMLRINEPPISAQATAESLTFHYEGDRWLRTALLKTDWPDLGKILDVECTPEPIDDRLYEALETIKPFLDKWGRVFIGDGLIQTTIADGEGAWYEVPDYQYEGVYQLQMLALLENVAHSIDFTSYPKPCIFYGENIRGAIIGMR